MRQIRLSTDRLSILQCQVISLYWACFPVSFWTNQFSFFEILHQSMNCFGRSNLKSQNPLAIFPKKYHNHAALGIFWSGKRDFAVLEACSLFFYQIFSSQVISKTRKTCRRKKGNLRSLLQESPQVFGIARLSEVGTTQISKKKNQLHMHGWNKLRSNKVGTRARSPRETGGCRTFRRVCVYIYIHIYVRVMRS